MEDAQRKMAEGRFTLDDFRKQMGMISKLGSMRGIMKMIPGLGQMADMDPNVDMDKEVRRIGAMIDSMTPDERRNPDRIDRGRRQAARALIGSSRGPVTSVAGPLRVPGTPIPGKGAPAPLRYWGTSVAPGVTDVPRWWA